MGIDLGSGDIGVAEHHLHSAKVRAMGEKMGGKGMAEHVWRDAFADTCGGGHFLENLPEAQAGHAAAAAGDKKVFAPFAIENMGAAMIEVVLYLFFGCLAKGDQSFLVTFSHYSNKAGVEITGSQRQSHQFRHPKPGGIEQIEHGKITHCQWC